MKKLDFALRIIFIIGIALYAIHINRVDGAPIEGPLAITALSLLVVSSGGSTVTYFMRRKFLGGIVTGIVCLVMLFFLILAI